MDRESKWEIPRVPHGKELTTDLTKNRGLTDSTIHDGYEVRAMGKGNQNGDRRTEPGNPAVHRCSFP